MRLIACGLFALSTFATQAALAQDDASVALVKSVSGSVSVMRAGAKLEVQPGFQLQKADEVVSQANSSSGIVFKDGTLLTVGAGSDVLIKDYVFQPADAKYAFAVYLAKGSAIYSSGKIGKLAPESVSVSTPKAVIGVRGTRFLVSADE